MNNLKLVLYAIVLWNTHGNVLVEWTGSGLRCDLLPQRTCSWVEARGSFGPGDRCGLPPRYSCCLRRACRALRPGADWAAASALVHSGAAASLRSRISLTTDVSPSRLAPAAKPTQTHLLLDIHCESGNGQQTTLHKHTLQDFTEREFKTLANTHRASYLLIIRRIGWHGYRG